MAPRLSSSPTPSAATSPSSAKQPSQSSQKRARIISSCDGCRSRKMRCRRFDEDEEDTAGADPYRPCVACLKHGHLCEWRDRDKYYRHRNRALPGLAQLTDSALEPATARTASASPVPIAPRPESHFPPQSNIHGLPSPIPRPRAHPGQHGNFRSTSSPMLQVGVHSTPGYAHQESFYPQDQRRWSTHSSGESSLGTVDMTAWSDGVSSQPSSPGIHAYDLAPLPPLPSDNHGQSSSTSYGLDPQLQALLPADFSLQAPPPTEAELFELLSLGSQPPPTSHSTYALSYDQASYAPSGYLFPDAPWSMPDSSTKLTHYADFR